MDLSKLNLLRQVEIQLPCPEDWESMDGDEARRFCAGCGCHVHNLAGLPAAEGEQLLASQSVCARITVDPEKGILTRDGWIPRLLLTGAMAAAAASAVATGPGDAQIGSAMPKSSQSATVKKPATTKKTPTASNTKKSGTLSPNQQTMGFVGTTTRKPTPAPKPKNQVTPPILGRPTAITGKIAAPRPPLPPKNSSELP